MKEYYVDVENVGIKWIDIYKEMSKNDKMIIYFSKHTHFINFYFSVILFFLFTYYICKMIEGDL